VTILIIPVTKGYFSAANGANLRVGSSIITRASGSYNAEPPSTECGAMRAKEIRKVRMNALT